ncbi:hypothetical protein T07_13895 [Trichinella nelsoni]|uniref:Uncharacterized protein n=1 Tax=Trichinella nelsoni TaxID=6336 RepID=A0A0V0RR12_9BILA|nr:hypothetical protein T07_13895 [Trichinella nelsoni]
MSTFVPPPQVRVFQRQLHQYEAFDYRNQGVSLPVLMRDQNHISTPCGRRSSFVASTGLLSRSSLADNNHFRSSGSSAQSYCPSGCCRPCCPFSVVRSLPVTFSHPKDTSRRVHSPEVSDKQRQLFIKEILEMRQRCRRNVVRVSKKAAQLTA